MMRTLSVSIIRSPLGSVRSLLSSRTLLRFSAHSGSTSPSKMIHCRFWLSPRVSSRILRRILVKTPSVHSRVVGSRVPYNSSLLIALGSIRWHSLLTLSTLSSAACNTRQAWVFPLPDGPTMMTPWLMVWTWLSSIILFTHASFGSKFCSLQISLTASRSSSTLGGSSFALGKTAERRFRNNPRSWAMSLGTMVMHMLLTRTSISSFFQSPFPPLFSASSLRLRVPADLRTLLRERSPKS
mmetsp:Transcript_27783/g.44163  ORF Transcript_27783/g.44163 Transcript_27783/m.44163 type:complete len:240 (+) Transcript_27783:4750-5469(+)